MSDYAFDCVPVPAMSTLSKRTLYQDEDGNYTADFRRARKEFERELGVKTAEKKPTEIYSPFKPNERAEAKAACRLLPKRGLQWMFPRILQPRASRAKIHLGRKYVCTVQGMCRAADSRQLIPSTLIEFEREQFYTRTPVNAYGTVRQIDLEQDGTMAAYLKYRAFFQSKERELRPLPEDHKLNSQAYLSVLAMPVVRPFNRPEALPEYLKHRKTPHTKAVGYENLNGGASSFPFGILSTFTRYEWFTLTWEVFHRVEHGPLSVAPAYKAEEHSSGWRMAASRAHRYARTTRFESGPPLHYAPLDFTPKWIRQEYSPALSVAHTT